MRERPAVGDPHSFAGASPERLTQRRGVHSTQRGQATKGALVKTPVALAANTRCRTDPRETSALP